jgi:hypothetical protein
LLSVVKGPEGNIAYEVAGDGPVDLVIVPAWLSHVDMMWGDPANIASSAYFLIDCANLDDALG